MAVHSPTDLINRRYNSLRNSEKRVAGFIQANLEEVIMMSIQGLAKKCSVSDATVLRFCRALGYLGYQDFKAALVPELLRLGYRTHQRLDKAEGPDGKYKGLSWELQHQLESTLADCDFEAIKKIGNAISLAKRILIVGLGGSAGVAHILCDSLGSLGIFSTFMHDRSIVQSLIPLVTDRDVVIGISHSGETEEVVGAISAAKDYGALTVGITNFSPSPLASAVDIVLITSVADNLLGSYSCQARMSQLALLELVLYELSEKLRLRRNQNESVAV